MKKYFKLQPHIYLVDGENGSCLYNTLNGDMITLNIEKANQLRDSENNVPLEKIDNVDLLFYSTLYEMELGEDYNQIIYIEKASLGKNEQMKKILPDCHQIPRAHIEITSNCNLNCQFCSVDENLIFRKTGCKKWKTNTNKLNLEQWKNVVDQLKKINCRELSFIGGEPLLEFELFCSILEYAHSIDIRNITLYTNGTLLNQEMISYLKHKQVKVIIQCLSLNEAIYEKMTGDKSAYLKVYNAIEGCMDSDVDFKILFLMTKYNENEYDDFMQYVNERKIGAIIEYIYPYPRNEHYSAKLVEKMNHHKRKLTKSTLPIFGSLKSTNCCYGGVIAVTSSGCVHPCILSRDILLGQLSESVNIVDCLAETYNEFKNLSKDKVVGCSTCSQRYGCIECRAIEMSATRAKDGMVNCDLNIGKFSGNL